MDTNCTSSGERLEILVHTSAQITNAQDVEYRQQGYALLAYLNRDTSIENIPELTTHIEQTPLPPQVLVPATTSEQRLKAIRVEPPVLSTADSILVAPNSIDSILSASAIYDTPAAPQDLSFKSITPSTASLDSKRAIPPASIKRKLPKSAVDSPKNQCKPTVWQDSDCQPNTTSLESVVSPDSLRFILRSPGQYERHKQELALAGEEPRRATEHQVLGERSPNRSRKIVASGVATKDQPPSTSSIPLSQVDPGNWLNSIAQLTSSSSRAISSGAHSTAQVLPTSSPLEEPFFSPIPVTGTEPFKTHVVGTLALVSNSQRLHAAYRPKTVTREIDILERGYWHLRVPYSWSSKNQEDFWQMLEEMIVEGKCGWGNWVEHIEDRASSHLHAATGNDGEPGQKCIAEIKVWCWGEVVREIWLALLMASRRQTLRLGMTWHDCHGNLVIQMR